MHKLFIAGCVGLIACASYAQRAVTVQAVMGTNDAVTVTFPQEVRGAVDSVYIASSSGTAEAKVGVVFSPHHGYAGHVQDIVGTNYAVTGRAIVRPRVTGNATDGTALASIAGNYPAGTGSNAVVSAVVTIPSEPIRVSAEPVSLVIQGSTTGVVWKATLVLH